MKIIADISNKTWVKEDQQEQSYALEVLFGFRDDGKLPVEFNSLSFGYSVYLGEDEVYKKSFPLDGVTYISTDQDYLEPSVVPYLIPEKNYLLNVWFENAGERSEDLLYFSLPKPPQPYPSWTYNEDIGYWEPPVAIPDEENAYIWDEETQQWNKLDL